MGRGEGKIGQEEQKRRGQGEGERVLESGRVDGEEQREGFDAGTR